MAMTAMQNPERSDAALSFIEVSFFGIDGADGWIVKVFD
jgi:hypothetical protein